MMKTLVTRRAGRILFTGFLVAQMLLSYVGQASLAQAQPVIPDAINTNSSGVINVPQYTGRGVEDSIAKYLCVPDKDNVGTALYTCITKMYRFGIAFGAIALVFFVVYAGYVYITGGEASKEKGKSILFSALTGMVIILTSYVLLSFINPDLVKIKPIQTPIFTASGLPSCEDVGLGVNCVLPSGQINYGGGSGGTYGGKGCTPITNNASPASVDNLSRSCFGQYGANVVKQASIVASSESGGNPSLPVGAGSCGKGKPPARCVGGEIPVWGLYQINLTVHKVGGLNCPAAFSGEWTCSRQCRVVNTALYNQCVAAAKNAANNIEAACVISQASLAAGKPRFNAWGNTANEHGKRCGF